jgi:hypothetical protein
MSTIDAKWFAEAGTTASWTHALLVQPALEDVEAAAADHDWDTCVLACLFAVEKLAFCDLMLDGRVATPREAELLCTLSPEASPIADALLSIHALRDTSDPDMGEDRARVAMSLVDNANAYVASRIPIDVLAMRTPEGFYPALRIAAELERLRAAVGLSPFEWEWWTNLS